jgi:hypothetical protein
VPACPAGSPRRSKLRQLYFPMQTSAGDRPNASSSSLPGGISPPAGSCFPFISLVRPGQNRRLSRGKGTHAVEVHVAGLGRAQRRQRHRQSPGGRKDQSDRRDCGGHTRAPGREKQRGTESARVASKSGRTRSYLPCADGRVRESEEHQVAFDRRCWFAWRTGTAACGRLRLRLH